MQSDCTYIPYSSTGYSSKIVTDYLQQDSKLNDFYAHPLSLKGIEYSIRNRKSFSHRSILTGELKKQYIGLLLSEKLSQNISQLSQSNTFTVTTAHQPNIFTGPVYFVYKILHAIKLANELTVLMPQYNFVPVYYMGSEDADIDELGSITIDGKKYTWQTEQTGAVGRMKIDKAFLLLINEMQNQVGVLPYGEEIIFIFKTAYTEGKTIQQATLEVVNSLFGEYGLIVLIPDNSNLKQLFKPIIEKELKAQFSYITTQATINKLEKLYKVQAGGRELNLFYLIDDKRERIEVNNTKFSVENLQLQWNLEEILSELDNYPERFSPNVILRGLFEETVLPNIAFIGGGGEVAYWLELKNTFDAVNVPFPLLILRNSFLIVENKWKQSVEKLNMQLQHIFLSEHEILKQIIEQRSDNKTNLKKEILLMEGIYNAISESALLIDSTLQQHTYALKKKAVERLNELEKKLLRAEKRRFIDEQRQVKKLKSVLFPNNNLQERIENIAAIYSRYGKEIFDAILKSSRTLQPDFGIITLPG